MRLEKQDRILVMLSREKETGLIFVKDDRLFLSRGDNLGHTAHSVAAFEGMLAAAGALGWEHQAVFRTYEELTSEELDLIEGKT